MEITRFALPAHGAIATLPAHGAAPSPGSTRARLWMTGLLLLLCLVWAHPAKAAWPGQNGKIFFTTIDGCCDRVWSVNPDGSELRMIHVPAGTYARDLEVSPDGQFLVYHDVSGDGNPLFVLHSDGSAPTRVDTGCGFLCGSDSAATWSPDGVRLLFTRSGPLDDSFAPPGVWTIRPDGTSKQRLVASESATDARWSPDGTQVSYHDNGQIYRVPADGSSPPAPVPQEFPTSRGLTPLSPDGAKTVFTHCCNTTPDQSEEIFVADAGGAHPRQVTFLTNTCEDPLWLCAGDEPLPFHPTQVQWQPIPGADVTPPSCRLGAPSSSGAQTSVTATVQDVGSGLASVTVQKADSVQFSLPDFGRATTDELSISVVNTEGRVGHIVLKLKDVAGNTARCEARLAPLLGMQTVGPAVDSNPGGLAEAFLVKTTTGGSAGSLSVYLASTSQASALVAGVYADSGSGHPGTLLAQGTLLGSPLGGAWNTISLPSPALTERTRYWIAILSPAGSGTLRFHDSCCGRRGTAPSETSAQANLTTLPSSWTKGSRYRTDGPISAWAGVDL